MATRALSSAEMKLWHAWKLAGATVMSAVESAIVQGSGLSGAEFGVLSRLEDLGGGELRQQDLAASMRWDKSRLSHQLTRMEARGLTNRLPADARGVFIRLTREGRKVLAVARPIHASAIREHLVGRLTATEQRALLRVCAKLGTRGEP